MHNNSRGASLIQVIVAIGLMAMLSLMLVNLMADAMKQKRIISSHFALTNLMQNVVNMARNQGAWNNTVDDVGNTTVGCLKEPPNPAQCNPPTTDGPIALRDVRNQIVVQNTAITPSAGFSMEGSPCNTYDDVNGDDSCPFRLNVSWKGMCPNPPGPPCSKPQVTVAILVEYKSRTLNFPINTARYSQDVVLPVAANFSGFKWCNGADGSSPGCDRTKGRAIFCDWVGTGGPGYGQGYSGDWIGWNAGASRWRFGYYAPGNWLYFDCASVLVFTE